MKMIAIFRLNSVIFLFGYFFISIFNFFPAQNTQRLALKKGLPSNNISCLHKDKNGILWIGTDDGLCSYDGREFTVYSHNNGLPNNFIRDIVETEKGEFWIGCYNGGIVHFDGKSFQLHDKDIPSKSIRKLMYSDGILYVGTDEHFFQYDGEKCAKNYQNIQVLEITKVNESIFVSTLQEGLCKLVFSDSLKTLFSLERQIQNKFSYGIKKYLDNVFVYTEDSLCFYSKNNPESAFLGQTFYLPSKINDAIITNDSSIFLSSWDAQSSMGGLYTLQKDRINCVNDEYEIKTKKVSCLSYDKNNDLLWVGTRDKGLFKVYLNEAITKPFNEYKLKLFEKSQLIKNERGVLYLINNYGIYSIDQFGLVQLLCPISKLVSEINKGGISNHHIGEVTSKEQSQQNKTSVLEIRKAKVDNDVIWISSNYGLFQLNTKNSVLKYKNVKGEVFLPHDNKLILQDPYRKVLVYDDIFSKDDPHVLDLTKGPSEVVDLITYKNHVWYATFSKGLIKQNGDEFISYYETGVVNEPCLSKLKLWNDSILIISSSLANVYGVVDDGDSLRLKFKLSSGKEIEGNHIYFLETFKEKLLIGTNKGIVIYDGKQTRLINDEEGYKMREVSSTLELDDGILICNNGSVIKLDIDNLVFDNTNRLYAKSFHTIDSIYRNNLNFLSTLTFPYNRNYYEVKFRYANLINPLKDVFTYDLHRWERKKWVNEYNSFFDPNKLSVWCTNLSPGKYRLRLNVKNKYTNKEAHSEYYHFQIIPPFWKTVWFIVSFSVFLVFCIVLITRYFIKRVKEKDKINLRISEIRLEALKAQMNPHFTFNIMNSIQNFVLDKNVDKALIYISNFSKLIRTVLDYSNKRTISLSEEIHFLENYVGLQNMRYGDKVKFNLNFPEEYIHKIWIPPMIIQPLIENVFVHAFSSESVQPKLDVNIFLKEDISQANTLYIEVKDNGVGRSNEKINTHLSKGLSIIQERLQLINKTNRTSIVLNYRDLKMENQESAGTEVQLQVPLVIS